MTIHPLSDAARAATNAIRFAAPIEEVAVALFKWQQQRHSVLIPASFPVPEPATATDDGLQPDAVFFQRRAAAIRARLAELSGKRKSRAVKGQSYVLDGGAVWYLAQLPNPSQAGSVSLVRTHAATYIRLVMQKELLEQSKIGVANTDPIGGFGPGVFIWHDVSNHGKILRLAELRFDIQAKHSVLICNVRASSFFHPDGVSPDRQGAIATGGGYSANLVDLGGPPAFPLDARAHPIRGINLRKTQCRRTRLYYLNILTEFALELFRSAGIPVKHEVFEATHVVRGGYLSLKPIASLARPLTVVNATSMPLGPAALLPLQFINQYFARGFHTSEGKIHFVQPSIRSMPAVPDLLPHTDNYLFLNGSLSGEASVVVHGADDSVNAVSAVQAYNALHSGDAITDAYTRTKFTHLMDQTAFVACMQGLDESPADLAALTADNGSDTALREKVKRCLIELSLKEIVAGVKPFPTPAFDVEADQTMTVIGTRSMYAGRCGYKTLIATASVDISKQGIWVRSTQRTPWSDERNANLSFVERFPFLLDDDAKVRDKQFWLVDPSSGKRLRVWAGNFIPKIILNACYAGIESALACQDGATVQGHTATAYYSKSKTYNLLPYYIAHHAHSAASRGDQAGRLIPLQDCGSWVRVFIPPADGLDGTGAPLSGMRDVMLYQADGCLVTGGLLDEPLMQTYLHTMTNGILVSGGNSKMSLLEKIVRLILQN